MRALSNIFWLGLKDSKDSCTIMCSGSGYLNLHPRGDEPGAKQQPGARNASIAIVDEDHSALSWQIASGFLPPYFKRPVPIQESDIDRLMNLGGFTFVLDIPPYFERDVRASRKPAVQLLVDATAMVRPASGRATRPRSSRMKSTGSWNGPNLSQSLP